MGKIIEYFRVLRPSQWYKNLLIPIVGLFTFQIHEFNLIIYLHFLLGFLFACGIAGFNYIINDIIDKESDKMHPYKKNRPIPAGEISERNAIIFGSIVLLFSLGGSFFLSFWFGIVMLTFFLLTQVYSFFLKKVIFVDILMISINFILRGAGGYVILTSLVTFTRLPTFWEYWAVFILALFLALWKRKVDLQFSVSNTERTHSHKGHLYPKQILDHLILIVSTIFLFSYYLYVILEDTTGGYLFLTVPVATYLMFRFLYLLFLPDETKTPPIKMRKDWGMAIGSIVVFVLFITIKYLETLGLI